MNRASQAQLSEIWLKASVVGGLWASIEIIAGSTLHNLRIPFAGTILASMGVCLLVAFHRHWPERGLLWRAGLVCALMKSISPSAIILGPMIGIFLEALLLETGIYLFGHKLLGYALGGSLALLAALVQKLTRLVITYGMDLVHIAENACAFAVKQSGITAFRPAVMLGVLLLFYGIIGCAAALLGSWVGSRARERKTALQSRTQTYRCANPASAVSPCVDQEGWRCGLKIAGHLFAVVLGLVFIGRASLWISALLLIPYLGLCFFHYKSAFRRLKRPAFWIQVSGVMLIAVLFWNGFAHRELLDPAGLLAGVRMNMRAILVVVCFASLGVELRNPVVRALLCRRGFAQLYGSLGLAFSVLPSILDQAHSLRSAFRHPVEVMAELLAQAESLLVVFKEECAGAGEG